MPIAARARQIWTGRGRIRVGTAKGQPMDYIGAVTSAEQTHELDTDEIPNQETPGGGNIFKRDRPKSVKLEFEAHEITDILLKLNLSASQVAKTAGAVTDESIIVAPGKFTPAANLIDTGVAPTLTAPAWAVETAYALGQIVENDTGKLYRCITAGTSAASPATGPSGTNADITDGTAHWKYVGTTIALNTDFAVTGGGIEISSASTIITVQTTLLLSYTKKKANAFEILAASNTEWYLFIEGENDDSDTLEPWLIEGFRTRFSPNGIKWIDAKHTSAKVSAELLLDTSQTGEGLSKFGRFIGGVAA